MTVTDVIDLREAQDDPGEDAPPHADTASNPRATRRVVVLVLLSLVALVVVDLVVGAAVHAEHQRHLASEIQEPKADLEVGDASYILQIPSLGLNEVVVEGSSATELRGGPGRRLDSVAAGEDGNTVIQGTSTRFGGPFGSLDQVVAGKSIYLQSRSGEVFKYKITKVRTVKDGDNGYLDAAGPARLTVVTSAQGPLSGARVVVTAVPDGVADDEAAQPPEVVDDGELPTGPEQVFDVRGVGGWLLLFCGFGLVAVGLFGASGLRRTYRTSTVVVVAGSSITLGLMLIVLNVSSFIPTTF